MKENRVIFLIVIAQFAATSLWFSGNAIYPVLQADLGFTFGITPKLTIAVQWGFILGTLLYAIAMIPDRFSPTKVFLVSAILAAIANVSILFLEAFSFIFLSRFLVGFFLAGIYPVGMKIVTDWVPKGVGKSLGFLVGALVLGTSLPHFIKANSLGISWSVVIISTSILAIMAGWVVYRWVGDGPHRKKAAKFSFKAFSSIFTNRMTNRASFGYFGHMWELYTFWAFTPAILTLFNEINQTELPISVWSFTIIGIGSIGCVVGGYLAKRYGSCRVAFFSMLFSGMCGLLSVFFFSFSPALFLVIMLIWGVLVIADSPQFSSVIADYADRKYLGSTLTIVNSIGFAITIGSIRLVEYMMQTNHNVLWILAVGPLLGLYPTGKIAFRSNFPNL